MGLKNLIKSWWEKCGEVSTDKIKMKSVLVSIQEKVEKDSAVFENIALKQMLADKTGEIVGLKKKVSELEENLRKANDGAENLKWRYENRENTLRRVVKERNELAERLKEKECSTYSKLEEVYRKAGIQAFEGKGKERHAGIEPYEEQPIMWIEKHFSSFHLGQAVKKIHESQGLSREQAEEELLGAINYIAAHIIHLSARPDSKK